MPHFILFLNIDENISVVKVEVVLEQIKRKLKYLLKILNFETAVAFNTFKLNT